MNLRPEIPRASQAQGILTDLAETNLAAAVELNSAEWLRLEGRLPWVELHDDGDVFRVFAGDTWPRNSVALARFSPASAGERVGEILTVHLRKKVACNWVVGPVSRPADLGRHLRAHGFRCRIHCAGMGCDLNSPPPSSLKPSGVAVTVVEEPPSLHPLTTERRRLRQEGRRQISAMRPQRVWNFAASTGGRVVGEASICAGAGVAGIYDVVVLERFRGRGIGTALVSTALSYARDHLGYRAAVLGATGMGHNLYVRLGFREVCKLSFWKYGKMRQLRV